MGSKTTRIAWNKGKKTPDDVKEKQRQAKLENPVRYWLGKKRPEQSELQKGKKFSESTKEKLRVVTTNKWKDLEFRKMMSKARHGTHNADVQRKNGLKGYLKLVRSKNPTSIEKIVYDYLLLKGILFEKQKSIGKRFVVDAYIPSLNLVIEADGTYWHSRPDNMERDKRKDSYLKTKGFSLIRLTDIEINSGDFKERIGL